MRGVASWLGLVRGEEANGLVCHLKCQTFNWLPPIMCQPASSFRFKLHRTCVSWLLILQCVIRQYEPAERERERERGGGGDA